MTRPPPSLCTSASAVRVQLASSLDVCSALYLCIQLKAACSSNSLCFFICVCYTNHHIITLRGHHPSTDNYDILFLEEGQCMEKRGLKRCGPCQSSPRCFQSIVTCTNRKLRICIAGQSVLEKSAIQAGGVVCPLLVFFKLLQRPDTSLPARYFCREGLYTAGRLVARIPSHK